MSSFRDIRRGLFACYAVDDGCHSNEEGMAGEYHSQPKRIVLITMTTANADP